MHGARRSVESAIAAAALVVMALWASSAGTAGRLDDRLTSPDPGRSRQWNLSDVGAPAAWATGRGAGASIAIVDTGIDRGHREFAGRIVATTSCLGAAGRAARCHGPGDDDSGHGTHVAGIAAAAADGQGVTGVAPDADLLAARVLTASCRGSGCLADGSVLDVVAGIRWAVAHRATVVNLSLTIGDAADEPELLQAIDDAWAAGTIVVVAAGNGTELATAFAHHPALVVTALDRHDQRAPYASDVGAARWGLAAPGGGAGDGPEACSGSDPPEGILSTWWDGLTPNAEACLSGTSMAAPHVAGAAAVLRGLGYSPRETVNQLLTTTRALGPPGHDATFGAGALDLARAVRAGSGPAHPDAERPRPALPGGNAGLASNTAAAPATGVTGHRPPPWLLYLAIAAFALSTASLLTGSGRRPEPDA